MSRPSPEEPGPGQESVWDYPRPPRLEKTDAHIVVEFGGQKIVDTRKAYRVLETSHPPVYYIPPEDFAEGALKDNDRTSFCEFKGEAHYYDVVADGQRAQAVAWYYPDPRPRFAEMAGYVAIYAGPMDSCTVDGEEVRPQPGGFYGGWITPSVVGPFKGGPGSYGW